MQHNSPSSRLFKAILFCTLISLPTYNHGAATVLGNAVRQALLFLWNIATKTDTAQKAAVAGGAAVAAIVTDKLSKPSQQPSPQQRPSQDQKPTTSPSTAPAPKPLAKPASTTQPNPAATKPKPAPKPTTKLKQTAATPAAKPTAAAKPASKKTKLGLFARMKGLIGLGQSQEQTHTATLNSQTSQQGNSELHLISDAHDAKPGQSNSTPTVGGQVNYRVNESPKFHPDKKRNISAAQSYEAFQRGEISYEEHLRRSGLSHNDTIQAIKNHRAKQAALKQPKQDSKQNNNQQQQPGKPNKNDDDKKSIFSRLAGAAKKVKDALVGKTKEDQKIGNTKVNQGNRAILKDGYYEVNGFKFSEKYYNKLWESGRKAPSLIAKEILETATKIVKDTMEGFFRYETKTWEMIYNPTTKEVWHLQPIKKIP